MAKKKHKKKHSFQHKNAPTQVAAAVTPDAKTIAKPTTMPNEWSEVAGDVRRSLVLAGIFITLMIGLWFLLNNTTLGQDLYRSIQL